MKVQVLQPSIKGLTGFDGEPGELGDTGEKGDTGATGETGIIGIPGKGGEKGPIGTGIKIKGSYGSLSELKTSIPFGYVGDIYQVDDAIYVWSESQSTWKFAGYLNSPFASPDDSRYTFKVDSDAALLAWASKEPGNDYSRVFIAPGEWHLDAPQHGTGVEGDPYIFIDCEHTGTEYAFGTPLSKLVFGVTPYISGMYDFFIDIYGLAGAFELSIKSFFSKQSYVYGFYSCKNLANCSGTFANFDSSSVMVRLYGFYSCKILANCSGTIPATLPSSGMQTGFGFYSCDNLISCYGFGNGSGGSGFYSCKSLTHCSGAGTNSQTGYSFHSCENLTNCLNTGIGYGFYSCKNLTNCFSSSTSTTTNLGFQSCEYLTNCVGYACSTSTISASAYGFAICKKLINCTGTGITASSGNGVGFYTCRIGFGNKKGSVCTTAAFLTSSAAEGCFNSLSPNTTFPWGLTADGGFNNDDNT